MADEARVCVPAFLHGGEVGPLLGRQLHLRPDDLERDAVAVRRIRRLSKKQTDTERDSDNRKSVSGSEEVRGQEQRGFSVSLAGDDTRVLFPHAAFQ